MSDAATPLGGTTVVDDSFDRWLKADEAEKVTPLLHPPPVLSPADNPPVQRTEVERPAEPVKEPTPVVPPPTEPEPPAEPTEETRPAAPDADETPEERAEGEKRGRKRPSWKEVRELEKQLKEEREARLRGEISRDELARRMENLDQQMRTLREPAREETPTEPEDPLDKANREIERLKQENQQRDFVQARMALDSSLAREESDFRKEHPEFDKALSHFVESEKKEWKAVGAVDHLAREILQRDPASVRQNAMRLGKSEAETAEEMAMGAILAARRDTIISSAKMAGRRVPEVIHELAINRGFKVEQPKEAPPARDKEAVREATRSLATATRSAPPPPKPNITSRRELMALDPKALEAYIMEHDATSPGWHLNLTE